MAIWKIYGILGLLGLPLMFYNLPIGLGWLVGHVVMVVLVFARDRFYDILLSGSEFRISQYASYIVFILGLISIPLLISFFFEQIMNPYAIFGAYFLDRIVHFVYNIFVKEETRALSD